jgi:hypothetical protein
MSLIHLAEHFPKWLWFQQKGYVTRSDRPGVIFARANPLSNNHATSHANIYFHGTSSREI